MRVRSEEFEALALDLVALYTLEDFESFVAVVGFDLMWDPVHGGGAEVRGVWNGEVGRRRLVHWVERGGGDRGEEEVDKGEDGVEGAEVGHFECLGSVAACW